MRLEQIAEIVVRLDERLKHDDTQERIEDLNTALAAVSTRLSAVEQRVWRASGFAAAIGAAIGFAAQFVH